MHEPPNKQYIIQFGGVRLHLAPGFQPALPCHLPIYGTLPVPGWLDTWLGPGQILAIHESTIDNIYVMIYIYITVLTLKYGLIWVLIIKC